MFTAGSEDDGAKPSAHREPVAGNTVSAALIWGGVGGG